MIAGRQFLKRPGYPPLPGLTGWRRGGFRVHVVRIAYHEFAAEGTENATERGAREGNKNPLNSVRTPRGAFSSL